MRVAVVGGGLAGIAAALECADAGAEVTLLEGRPRLGGATFSIRRDGIWMDNGQHVFLRCCTEYRRFLERIDADAADRAAEPALDPGRLARAGASRRIERARLPAPAHLLPSLARFPYLSRRDRIGDRARRPSARRSSISTTRRSTAGRSARGSREHGQSPAAVDALWNLIVLPTVNLPATEASLALAAKVFQTGLLEAADAGRHRLRGRPAAAAARRHRRATRSSAPASTCACGRGSNGSSRGPAASPSRFERGRRGRRRGRAHRAARRRGRAAARGRAPARGRARLPRRVADREPARRLRPAR